MSKRLCMSGLAMAMCFIGFAQTNFTGTWVFKSQESISGTLYGNGSPKQVKIAQTSSNVLMEKLNDRGDGTSSTTTETVGFDGKESTAQTVSKKKKVLTLTWDKDQKTFTEIVNIFPANDQKNAEHKQTDTYSLSDDGKTLTLDRKDENFTNGETWESVATYDKQ